MIIFYSFIIAQHDHFYNPSFLDYLDRRIAKIEPR